MGLGDDSNGTTEEDYTAWKDALEKQIGDHFKLQPKESLYEPNFEIPDLDKKAQDLFEKQEKHAQADLQLQLHGGRLKLPASFARDLLGECKEDPSRHCLHLEFDLPSPSIRYETGDSLQVLKPISFPNGEWYKLDPTI